MSYYTALQLHQEPLSTERIQLASATLIDFFLVRNSRFLTF